MYAPHMQQQLAYRPDQLNRPHFVPPQPSAGFNVRIPWGMPVRFPRGPLPQFPSDVRGRSIPPFNPYHQVHMEQCQGNGMSYGEAPANLNNLYSEIKALHQQLAQALGQRAAQDSEIDRLKGLVQEQQGELDSMTQKLHKSTVVLEAEQEQERQRQKALEQKQQKEHKEWKEREQVLKDELAKRQSELENNTVHRDTMNDYAHYQPHRRNYYPNNDRRRNRYENNNQGNRRQRVPYNGEQFAGQMGYPDHGQNNSREYFNPRGRQPYHQRNRDGNFGDIPQRHHRRVNNRGQPFTHRNRHVPVQEPKLSKYDGSIPWRVYEVKLLHLAQRYQWDDDTKLSKLVEALEGRALIFFSNLPINVQGNFEVVQKKMNNRFLPKEPAITVRKQLQTIRQNVDERLEEWAERCQQCAYDAWGNISPEVAELAAVEAFLGGVLETEAAISIMEKGPQTVDEALEMLRKAVHGRKSLGCRFGPTQKDFSEKFESELKDLWSSVVETQKEIVKILELLSRQERDSIYQIK